MAQIVSQGKPKMLPVVIPQEELPFEPGLLDDPKDFSEYSILKDLAKRDDCKNTTDWDHRKIEDWIPVFVYGSLKSGGWLHSVLQDSFWLGDGLTATKEYNMYDSGNNFPVVRDVHKDHEMAGRVVGEIYMVDPVTLLELDRIESNNYMYYRKQVWVWAQDQLKEVEDQGTGLKRKAKPAIFAWTYIGCNDFWRGRSMNQVVPKKINGIQMYDWDVLTKRT